MLRTMTLSVGELISVASAVSRRAPAAYIPCAIGVAQLTQTPSGAPTNMPDSVLSHGDLKLRCLTEPRMVNAAAAKRRPNAIPFQFVYNQFTVVFATRSAIGWSSVTGNRISNAIELKLVRSPIWAFSLSAGIRDWDQKTAAITTAKRSARMRRLLRRNVGCTEIFALTINHHPNAGTRCASRLSLYPERESNLGCIQNCGQAHVCSEVTLGLSKISISGDNQEFSSYLV